jgi:hypothetical protein
LDARFVDFLSFLGKKTLPRDYACLPKAKRPEIHSLQRFMRMLMRYIFPSLVIVADVT